MKWLTPKMAEPASSNSKEFDLVVTDIIMPEMEGIETVMAVREQFPTVAIIAMSGGGRVGNNDFLEVARKLGASGVVHKPFTAGNLDEAIKQAFDATKSA